MPPRGEAVNAQQILFGFLLYSYASGDKDATDGNSETFQNLFATTHLHYGYMDLNSLQNLHDIRVAYTAKPLTNISLAAEVHFQFLDQTTDFWYNVAGVPRNFTGAAVGSGGGYRINPSYSNTLGTEIDLVAAWTFKPYAQIEVGVSRYFRGDYIKQSLAAVGSKDANYAYFQLTLNLWRKPPARAVPVRAVPLSSSGRLGFLQAVWTGPRMAGPHRLIVFLPAGRLTRLRVRPPRSSGDSGQAGSLNSTSTGR